MSENNLEFVQALPSRQDFSEILVTGVEGFITPILPIIVSALVVSLWLRKL